MSKLFRLALDGLLRQRERTALTVLGLALAIAPFALVFSISLRFESTSRSQFAQSSGLLSDAAVAALARAGGITASPSAIVGEKSVGTTTLAVSGAGDGSGTAMLGSGAASAHAASVGSRVDVRGLAGSSTDFTVTSDPAVQTVGTGALGLAFALNGQLSRFDVSAEADLAQHAVEEA